MYQRALLVVVLSCALSLGIPLIGFSACGAEPLPEGEASLEMLHAPPSVLVKTPVAIGMMPQAGAHLVKPSRENVEMLLQSRGVISKGASRSEVESAVNAYYKKFAKKSRAWTSPEAQGRALERELELSAADIAPSALQPVTAGILALAVDFGGTDTFSYSAPVENGQCEDKTVTTSGPLKGLIPHPSPKDNFSVWYDPANTADPKFYEKLIFGYEGVGRSRMDLTDPNDGQPGINLAGYTVQDYYDHVAGPGNVSISGKVDGWVTVDHSEGYYGADKCSSGSIDAGPAPVAQLVVDALEKFKQLHPEYYDDTSPDAFWPKFDANQDGVVDTFWIIHAGKGQEAGGGAQGDFAIWSHSSDIRTWTQWPQGYKVYEGDPSTTADDIVVGPYTMQPEDADLGTLCEEFGHNLFGLPDLYTSDAKNSVGFWSIMSDGAWGGLLGGATPVGMPLWFDMIAWCGTDFCNWQEPMVTFSNKRKPFKATIGRLESTPSGIHKGVRINVPDFKENVPNRAGDGKGAYTGVGLNMADLTLERQITIGSGAKGILSLDSYWDIEKDWDYAYVMLKSGSLWINLDDMDGFFTEDNPNGNNIGHGLTGTGSGKLRFDLSAFKGKKVTVQLRYKTDQAATLGGWWVDNVNLDGGLIDDFSSAVAPRSFPGWKSSKPGWAVTPTTFKYASYYLVEWRADTKYDKMVRTAYSVTSREGEGLAVERIPYNIPGALVYYRNAKYSDSYSLIPNLFDPPSIGPKYQLLVVDMSYGPMRLGDSGYMLGPHAASYDAALTLQPADPFTISRILTSNGSLAGPWSFPASPAVKQFDDVKGYYAGFYGGDPCPDGKVCWSNGAGSAVIPAAGNYTTRITHYDGSPYPELYGETIEGSVLGTGNPGDAGMQHGVRVGLLSKSEDNSKALLIFNAPVQPDLIMRSMSAPSMAKLGGSMAVQCRVENQGYKNAASFNVNIYLSKKHKIDPSSDRLINSFSVSELAAGSSLDKEATATIPSDLPVGSWYVSAIVDADKSVVEFDESNNSKFSAQVVRVTK